MGGFIVVGVCCGVSRLISLSPELDVELGIMNDVSQHPESCSFGADGDERLGVVIVVIVSDNVTPVVSLSKRSAALRGPGNGIK